MAITYAEFDICVKQRGIVLIPTTTMQARRHWWHILVDPHVMPTLYRLKWIVTIKSVPLLQSTMQEIHVLDLWKLSHL